MKDYLVWVRFEIPLREANFQNPNNDFLPASSSIFSQISGNLEKSEIFEEILVGKNGKNCDSHLAHFHYRDGCLVSLRHHHFSISHPPSPPKKFCAKRNKLKNTKV